MFCLQRILYVSKVCWLSQPKMDCCGNMSLNDVRIALEFAQKDAAEHSTWVAHAGGVRSARVPGGNHARCAANFLQLRQRGQILGPSFSEVYRI